MNSIPSLSKCENVRIAYATVSEHKGKMLEISVRVDLIEFKIKKKEDEIALAKQASLLKEKTTKCSNIAKLEMALERLRDDLVKEEHKLTECEEIYDKSLEELQEFLCVNPTDKTDDVADFPPIPLEIELR